MFSRRSGHIREELNPFFLNRENEPLLLGRRVRSVITTPTELLQLKETAMKCRKFCVYCCHLMCICCTVCALLFFTLDAGLLARSQYSEGPATGHIDTGFSWFPCVYKQMLKWFSRFQVATTCFSCSPPDLNLLVTNFIFRSHVK